MICGYLRCVGMLGNILGRSRHAQWRKQEVLFGGATININHISKQQKTQEEEKNLYHYHYI